MIKQKIQSQILNGALTNHKTYLADYYKGYYITTEMHGPVVFVKIAAKCPSDEKFSLLHDFIKEMDSPSQNTRVNYTKNMITFSIPNSNKKSIENLNLALESVIQHITENGYGSGCMECGDSSVPLNTYEFNKHYVYFCESCFQKKVDALEEHQKKLKSQKSNILLGALGAILGALLGGVLWVLIGRIGFIAGLAGFAAAYFAFKGYEKLGKHLDKIGVIISLLSVIIIIYFANKLSLTWFLYDELKEFGFTFSSCYHDFWEIAKLCEITDSFFTDLVLGYLLTALSCYRYVIYIFKSSSGSYTAKKM